MARLIQFHPDEQVLYEALWVIFSGADYPSAKEVKVSLRLEDLLRNHGHVIKNSIFMRSICPTCRQRTSQREEIMTLEDGNLIIEDNVLDYLAGCFDKWQMVPPELKRSFAELQDRLEKWRQQPSRDIKAIEHEIVAQQNTHHEDAHEDSDETIRSIPRTA